MGENSLVFDHPGKTSKLESWTVGWMERRSIVVKNGSHLDLSNIVAVELPGDLLSGLSSSLIYVRPPPVSVDMQSPFTVSDSHISTHCRTIPYYLQICDFSSAPGY
ncbi:hypothetical protein E2C01_076795 [Portunus trituberculatus]|uniref:Uncharacterized protein n=1 Tax=Portunus trituberculatus TaxID=210409 RepID=A0A5B7IJI6_PORTR|nr:hypothetical protein [Portunus trituberculatus]